MNIYHFYYKNLKIESRNSVKLFWKIHTVKGFYFLIQFHEVGELVILYKTICQIWLQVREKSSLKK
jgi:hypothetical protein